MRRVLAAVAFVALVCGIVPLVGSESASTATLAFGRAHRRFQPLDGKVYVLIVGNDARSGNPDNVRADALHLVGFNVNTGRGGIINFPRDSYVPIPGSGTARINESLNRGGPDLVVQTVESLTGIKIDYWIMTGFVGFQGMLDELGEVRYHIDRDIFDPTGSGARLKKGTDSLKSWQALAYVRTRHNFPNGDIDRTTNQAKFLLALLQKFQRVIDRNPAELLDWMAAVQKHTRLNPGPDELFKLAILASQVEPRKVKSVTVPVTLGSAGAASVVFIQPEAQGIYNRLKSRGSL